jgi:hypothetical protein
MILVAHFANEIAAVTEAGGEALPRERVAGLDDGQQRVLRGALDVVAIA